MKRMSMNEWIRSVEFEALEARLLLAAAPFVQPDGPMPQAAGPGCGPPVEEASEAADADGDGKLGLNDVKTSAAPEPTSLTFNGRGIDLNEDATVDALAAAAPFEVHQADSTDVDMLLIGKVLKDTAEARFGAGYKDGKLKLEFAAEDDDIIFLVPEFNPYEQAEGTGGEIVLWEWDFDCNGAPCDAVVAYEWDTTGFLSGGPIGAIMGGVGGTNDQGQPVLPDETPIVMDVLGSTKDFQLTGADGIVIRMVGVNNDVDRAEADALAGAGASCSLDAGYKDGKLKLELPQDAFAQAPNSPHIVLALYNIFTNGAGGSVSYMIGVHSSTSDSGAGHCKIMAVRVANPEGSAAAGGPLGAIMGGIGSIMGQGGGIGGILGGGL